MGAFHFSDKVIIWLANWKLCCFDYNWSILLLKLMIKGWYSLRLGKRLWLNIFFCHQYYNYCHDRFRNYVCLSISLSLCLSVSLSLRLSVSLSLCLCCYVVLIFFSLSVFLLFCLSKYCDIDIVQIPIFMYSSNDRKQQQKIENCWSGH